MSFCPLESYEREETKAEFGSSGVFLMASLLPICDIRWKIQGNCQGGENALPLYRTVYIDNQMCSWTEKACKIVCIATDKGKHTRNVNNEKDDCTNEEQGRLWKNGASDERHLFSQSVSGTWWHLLSYLSTVTLHWAKGKQEAST